MKTTKSSRCVILRRVKFSGDSKATEQYDGRTRWVTAITDARVFKHAGHAKNAIHRWDSSWHHQQLIATGKILSCLYVIVPVTIAIDTGAGYEWKPEVTS
jgi:hypothetical protein